MAVIQNILKSNWPLFFGVLFLMIGNGLQGTLLGLRADLENFDTLVTGALMSCYYIGFLGGFMYAPGLISSVGHIRVFAALASLASTTILLHGLFLSAPLWAAVRLLSGFCFAGLYIVMESWLNKSASNKARGTVMSIYTVLTYVGMVIGQFMLNIAEPTDIMLFALTSITVSIAMLPVALSRQKGPEIDDVEPLPFKKLFTISPLGVVGTLIAGACSGTLLAMGAVYASQSGFSIAQISLIMALLIAGGAFVPMLMGFISDYMDRRHVIIAACLLAFFISLGFFVTAAAVSLFYFILVFLIGGFVFSVYPLSVAHVNDHLKPRQILPASSALILVNGIGSCFGPIYVSVAMGVFGENIFFPAIGFVLVLMGGFGIYRLFISDPVPIDDQGEYSTVPMRPTQIAMQQIMEEDDN